MGSLIREREKEDMFKYNYVADLFDRLVKNASFPMQVELHPGHACGFNCRYCYGKSQRLNEGILTIEEYSNLLDAIAGKTHLIDISGIASDPMSYPYFCELVSLIKKRGFNFGIHTKGDKLNKKFIKLLHSGKTEGSFITLSLDSADRDIYNTLHGIKQDSVLHDSVLEKIAMLKTEKIKSNSELRINITYLLFRDNSKEKDIEQFIQTFEPFADILRFSIPQVPNQITPVKYLKGKEISNTLTMLKDYENEKVVVLKFDYSEHDKSFNTCWSQRFNVTIDKAGNVFPCPQVATSVYNHIRYGNIKEQNIWEIWESKQRANILNMNVNEKMKCRVCDRKDENINIELEKILNPNKYI